MSEQLDDVLGNFFSEDASNTENTENTKPENVTVRFAGQTITGTPAEIQQRLDLYEDALRRELHKSATQAAVKAEPETPTEKKKRLTSEEWLNGFVEDPLKELYNTVDSRLEAGMETFFRKRFGDNWSAQQSKAMQVAQQTELNQNVQAFMELNEDYEPNKQNGEALQAIIESSGGSIQPNMQGLTTAWQLAKKRGIGKPKSSEPILSNSRDTGAFAPLPFVNVGNHSVPTESVENFILNESDPEKIRSMIRKLESQ